MSSQRTTKAVRLVFSYEGDRVELIAQQPLETITQPSDEIDDAPQRSGFWFQLEDAAGAALYQRVAQNPIRPDREIFSPEGETVGRVPDVERKGVFTIVVPDVKGAERVTLQSDQPATREGRAESAAPKAPRPATTIASFKLDYKK
jgi:hypothetical protein